MYAYSIKIISVYDCVYKKLNSRRSKCVSYYFYIHLSFILSDPQKEIIILISSFISNFREININFYNRYISVTFYICTDLIIIKS